MPDVTLIGVRVPEIVFTTSAVLPDGGDGDGGRRVANGHGGPCQRAPRRAPGLRAAEIGVTESVSPSTAKTVLLSGVTASASGA